MIKYKEAMIACQGDKINQKIEDTESGKTRMALTQCRRLQRMSAPVNLG